MQPDILADLLHAVEQQLDSPQTRYVRKTFDRLTGLGLTGEDAKTQIALCLGEEMDEVARRKRAFDEKAYRAALDTLPAADEPEEASEAPEA